MLFSVVSLEILLCQLVKCNLNPAVKSYLNYAKYALISAVNR